MPFPRYGVSRVHIGVIASIITWSITTNIIIPPVKQLIINDVW